MKKSGYIVATLLLIVVSALVISSTKSRYQDRFSNEDYCALYQTIRNSNLLELETLLKQGIDLNVTGCEYDELPLFFSVKHQVDVEFFEMLVQSGANINQIQDGTPLLFYAYDMGTTDIINYLLTLDAIDLNVSKNGIPFISHVMNASDIALFDRLVSMEVNIPDVESGDVFELYKMRNVDLVRQLVEGGFDLSSENEEGKTLLEVALDASDRDMILFLLENDADPHLNGSGSIVLYAIEKNDFDLLDLLASKNYDFNDYKGTSPLFYALDEKNYAMLRYLLESGMSPHVSLDERPLGLLALDRGMDVFELLLNHGLNINETYDGKTLFHYLLEEDELNPKIVYLLSNQFDLYEKNGEGLTRLDEWLDHLDVNNINDFIGFFKNNEIFIPEEEFTRDFYAYHIQHDLSKRLSVLEFVKGTYGTTFLSKQDLYDLLTFEHLMEQVDGKYIYEAYQTLEFDVFDSYDPTLVLSLILDGNPYINQYVINQEYIEENSRNIIVNHLMFTYMVDGKRTYLSLADYYVINDQIEKLLGLTSVGYKHHYAMNIDPIYYNKTPLHHAHSLEMIENLYQLGYDLNQTYQYMDCTDVCSVYKGLSILNGLNFLSLEFLDIVDFLGTHGVDFNQTVEVYEQCNTFDACDTLSSYTTHIHEMILDQRISIEIIRDYLLKAVDYGFDVQSKDSNGMTVIDYLNQRNESETGEKIIKDLIKKIT